MTMPFDNLEAATQTTRELNRLIVIGPGATLPRVSGDTLRKWRMSSGAIRPHSMNRNCKTIDSSPKVGSARISSAHG
jgi:hypothetical protein